MEIRIDTYVERPDGSRHPVNRAFFVMVALDANNKPVTIGKKKYCQCTRKWRFWIKEETRKQII